MENQTHFPARKRNNEAVYEGYGQREAVPLKVLCQRWISSLDAMPRSIASYESNMKRFFAFLEAQNIEKPNPMDILQFKKSLEEAGLKASSINTYLTTLKIFFGWTARHGLYPDVTQDVKLIRAENGHKRDSLTEDECVKLLLAVRDTNRTKRPEKELRDFAIIWLLLATGIRTKEASEADISDLQTKQGETVLFIRGKGRTDKDRFVIVPDEALEALKNYFAIRFPDGQIRPQEPLFVKTTNNRINGARMEPQAFTRLVKAAFKAAGMDSDRLTAHSLRHTAANLNLLNGGTLRETQQMLGHKQIVTTMVYLDDIERMKNQSEKRIAQAIASRFIES